MKAKQMRTTEELIQRALDTRMSDTEQHYALTAVASALNDIAKALNKILENKGEIERTKL